jgi:hypothetical protein
MREIYNRDPLDPNYNPYQIETSDPVEICVGQIKMLLLTNKGEVLGDPKFGLNLEDLIFTLNLSEASIKKELDLFLQTYIPLFKKLGGSYSLKFYQGTQRDIATLDFNIPVNGGLSPVVTLRIT